MVRVSMKMFQFQMTDLWSDPVLIRDQLLSMLLASRDTVSASVYNDHSLLISIWQTACVLTYITYFMAIHPDVTQKLRTEVLERCGPTSSPTFEHFRDMKYSVLISRVDLVISYLFIFFSESSDKWDPSFVPSSTPQCPWMSLYAMHFPSIRSNIP